jgi:hypothetical protein
VAEAQKELVWYDIDTLTEWNENPNEGDVGSIVGSVLRFGFHDELNVYHNEIMAGNHRLKTLYELKRMLKIGEQRKQIERALQLSTRLKSDGNGRWLVGGSDISHLDSRQEAQAYGVANNRTTRLGQDDPKKLLDLLQDIAGQDEQVLGATGYDLDDIDDMLQQLTTPMLDNLADQYGEPGDRDFWPIIRVQVSPETFELYQTFMKQIPGEDETNKMAQIIGAVDATAFEHLAAE